MKICICVVSFNKSLFIEKQITNLKHYIRNNFDLKYVDNSTDINIQNEIKIICDLNNVSYERHKNPYSLSLGHATSLNYMYNKYSKEYDFMVFLDHDIFLFNYIDFNDYINYKFIGCEQERNGIIYIWPGCMFINNKLYGKYDCDFRPSLGCDTGGSISKIISNEMEYVYFLNSEHIKNNFNGNYYDFYSEIDNKWFHFINGSNWNNQSNEEERIELLFKLLEEKYI